MSKSASNNEIINTLTREGHHWGKNTLAYSFDTYGFRDNSGMDDDLNTAQIDWIKKALVLYSEIIDLSFVPSSNLGDLSFNGAFKDTAGTSKHMSNADGFVLTHVGVILGQYRPSLTADALSYGSWGFKTILHEIGHALGLSHPGEYAGFGASYANDAAFEQDTERYTIMSYFKAHADGSGANYFNPATGQYVYPQTPMVYDILALTQGGFDGQFSGYSLNASTRASNTAYGYGATDGVNEVYDFSINTLPVLTIYDTDGVDTLDLSGDVIAPANGNGNVVSLYEGSYSSTHGLVNNIGIAYGTVLENVVGSNFNDTVIGNYAANVIDGQYGDDSLSGGAGDDNLHGGSGDDSLNGGPGDDSLNGGPGDDSLNGRPGNDTVIGASGNDTLNGGTYNDYVSGGPGNDKVSGDAGHDGVYGGEGDDILYGGSGVDTVAGGSGDDLLDAGVGDDLLNAGAGHDFLFGRGGNDTLMGADGKDQLFGGAGDDVINAGNGDDYIFGGEGYDIFVFSSGHGNDTIYDFSLSEDALDLTDFNHRFATVKELGLFVMEVGDGIIIHTSGEGAVTILGISLSDLDSMNILL